MKHPYNLVISKTWLITKQQTIMKRFLRFFQRAQMLALKRFSSYFRVQVQRPLQKHGSDYGGWHIDPTNINAESIVYSFGVGEDISFDLSLIQTFGCQVYAFDPTPKSIAWANKQILPPQFHFFDYGIADYDGQTTFNPPINPDHVSYTMLTRPETSSKAIQVPVYRLQTIMNRLGHNHIDLLKMDVEGAEYAVLQQFNQSEPEVDQLLVEFHHRFESVGWQSTRTAIKTLNQRGYRTFFVSSSGEEYSFTRVSS